MQADETITIAQFTAKQDTVIKGKDASSQSLPDDQKLSVPAKAVLTATIVSQSPNTYVVENASLDGKALPAHLRYLHRPHFGMEPVEAPAVAAPKPPAPKPAAAAPKAKTGSKDDEIRALLAEGKSVSFIAREVKVGRATVKRVRDGESAN